MNTEKEGSCDPQSSQQTGDALCENIAIQKDVTKGSVSQAVSPTVSLASGGEKLKTDTQSSKFGNESCSKQPNCYECVYRGGIPGNAHSKCLHPSVVQLVDTPLFELLGMLGSRRLGDMSQQMKSAYKLLNIEGNEHGKKSGWFNWPINFDPIWLISCDGFEEKK